jgi:hypothetical protein
VSCHPVLEYDDGSHQILEVDESQHFNEYRALTLRACVNLPVPASGRAAADPLPRPAPHLRHPAAGGRHQPEDRIRGARPQGRGHHPGPLQPRRADDAGRGIGRLDAMLGRSPLDAPDVGEEKAPASQLWLDEVPDEWAARASTRDKGADKGAGGGLRATKGPDLSSDRADEGEFGTAYRIRTGDLRLERAVS